MVTWQQLQKPIGQVTPDANLLALLKERNSPNTSGGQGMSMDANKLGQLTQLLGQFGGESSGGDFSSFGGQAAGTATEGISATSAAPMLRKTNMINDQGVQKAQSPNIRFSQISPSSYGDPNDPSKKQKNNWAQETREIASGAMRGAQIGSLAGPWGTAIGAGIGGLLGFFG